MWFSCCCGPSSLSLGTGGAKKRNSSYEECNKGTHSINQALGVLPFNAHILTYKALLFITFLIHLDCFLRQGVAASEACLATFTVTHSVFQTRPSPGWAVACSARNRYISLIHGPVGEWAAGQRGSAGSAWPLEDDICRGVRRGASGGRETEANGVGKCPCCVTKAAASAVLETGAGPGGEDGVEPF